MRLPAFFNCSNDMALAANVRQYFPPKRIQQMEEDLKDLAQYWDEGPWGWSLCTKQRYRKMGIGEEDLPGDEWLDEVRQLSSREYACRYIHEMLEEIDDDRLVGHDMKFFSNPELSSSLQRFGTKNYRTIRTAFANSQIRDKNHESLIMTHPTIFKSPWSSSGRGIFTSHKLSEEQIEKKLQGFISTQGGFVMDRFYDKELDFAMEFYVHEDHSVDYLGLSVFHAEENGAYGYNLVEDQHALRAHVSKVYDLIERLIEYHRNHLGKTAYYGPVGIDMLLCKDGRIHPCIEINMRMNMGILALNLFNKYGSNANVQLTPHREHGFEAKIEDGKLMITYSI